MPSWCLFSLWTGFAVMCDGILKDFQKPRFSRHALAVFALLTSVRAELLVGAFLLEELFAGCARYRSDASLPSGAIPFTLFRFVSLVLFLVAPFPFGPAALQ
jgi:hypothetical protein